MIDSDNWTPWTASGELTDIPPTNGPTYTTPSELRALGAAIGKIDDYGAFAKDVADRYPKVMGHLSGREAANDNYPRLVALTGSAGSGKSTATRFLVERHGYTLVKFAGPLKDMLRAIGLDEDEIEGEAKESPSGELCGKTPRHAMQTLGTEWGRKCIGDDFWIGLWRRRVQTNLADGNRVVCDDCRFPNEAEAIRQLGGMIIKLEGRGGIAGQHASEAGCGQHDAVVTNDGGVVDLYSAVEQEVQKWAA
ncbi:deoxynucleotide monophosphate kinase family protein [Sinorhizobium medicae]